jgi:hypothetical protein
MQGKSLFTIVIAALVLVAGGYALLGERQSAPDDGAAGQRLYPGLEQQLNGISRIRMERNGATYEVLRDGDQWQLPGKGGYPVQFARVKPLLLGIALLEKVEPKTANSENYARLGVQDPGSDTHNTRIELYESSGEPVASLIVGKVRGGLIAGGRDGIYARISGDARAWLLAGELALPESQVDWVDRQIVHIKPKSVKRVTITQPDGSSLVVEKPHKGAASFSVSNVPDGAVLKPDAKINPLAQSLAGLKMEDLLVRSQAGLAEADAVVSVFETWDGLQVTAYSVEQDNKIYAWFDAGAAALGVNDLTKVRTTELSVAELRARLDGWVYQLPRERGEKLRKRLDDLLETEDG